MKTTHPVWEKGEDGVCTRLRSKTIYSDCNGPYSWNEGSGEGNLGLVCGFGVL